LRIAVDATSVRRPSSECTVSVSVHSDLVLWVSHLPEVNNDLVILSVTAVIGMFLPVIDVDVSNTTDQEFEFSLIENVDQVCWNQLVEAGNECVELLLDSFLDAPFGDETERLALLALILANFTYSTYSFLFSFVTSISSPPGFSSMLTVSPNRSSSVLKVNSSASVMSLLLLHRKSQYSNVRVITYSIHSRLRWKSASTPSISPRATFFLRIIL
jgi:hypothetical protein